ncbi:hypothetical protein L1987_23733 [Smallanthus sonchifolius]|uniref:Uncharacterized protein n=1 Tax=Smallanthus sonchifolius TaxID=185202 RepID=A0ACB9IIQ6_9ASTR|nr:hypothetical protein L1987_23733 [Smallanthus sonchifolius]
MLHHRYYVVKKVLEAVAVIRTTYFKMSSRVATTPIGIDLGTTYSCVAAWFDQHDRVEILPNEQGCMITPSCVACTGKEIFVGDAAKNQITRNPTNKEFSPEEISSMILKNLKEAAEAYLGTTKRQKKDISKNARSIGRLKVACEKAKRELSSTFEASIDIDCFIKADEAVAYGAAVWAANLSGNGNKAPKDLVLLDVTPLSLGTSIKSERYMDVIIPRNTPIPTMHEHIYVTLDENQESMTVDVYQGECDEVKDNIFLDQFTLYGVPPAPAGKERLKVWFSIGSNGILDVSAELVSTGNRRSIVIAGSGNVSKDDIEKMLKKAAEIASDKDQESEHADDKKRNAAMERLKKASEGTFLSQASSKQ